MHDLWSRGLTYRKASLGQGACPIYPNESPQSPEHAEWISDTVCGMESSLSDSPATPVRQGKDDSQRLEKGRA